MSECSKKNGHLSKVCDPSGLRSPPCTWLSSSGPDAYSMSFWKELDSWAILLSLGCSRSKPFLKLVQFSSAFLGPLTGTPDGTQWEVLMWGLGGSSASPWKDKLRHRPQNPGDTLLPKKPSLLTSYLSIFISFLFSFFSSWWQFWGGRLGPPTNTMSSTSTGVYHTISACPSTTPSLCTITTFQAVSEDLPRWRTESWSTAAGGVIDAWRVWRAHGAQECCGLNQGMKETSYQLVVQGQREGGKDEWGKGRERGRREEGRDMTPSKEEELRTHWAGKNNSSCSQRTIAELHLKNVPPSLLCWWENPDPGMHSLSSQCSPLIFGVAGTTGHNNSTKSPGVVRQRWER